MDKQAPQRESRPPELKQSNQALRFAGLGFQMLVTMGVAGWLGYLIDSWLHTLPLFLLVLLLSVFSGQIYLLLKSNNDQTS